jgi:hypothetical protein
LEFTKIQKNIDGHNHHKGDKKGRPKDVQPVKTKKRERASPFHGRKLSHPF